MKHLFTIKPWAVLLFCCIASVSNAQELVKTETMKLNVDLEIGFGAFHSSQDYHFMGTDRGSVGWEEGYIEAGLSGNINNWYGGVSFLSSATFGNGDAGGFTTGAEREADVENAFLGWKNEQFDVSFGKQGFMLGDGFIIAHDALNFGLGFKDIGGGEVNRGGAYWLAPRQAFNNTFIAKYQTDTPLRGDFFWLQSGIPAQASTELVGLNLEWVDEKLGTLGGSLMKVVDVNKNEFFGTYAYRDDMTIFSIRGQGSMGIENTFLSFEVVHENFDVPGRDDGYAWYVEGEYTLPWIPMSPAIGYRYSFFSETYDPLFYGMTRGYGTWFQGEVSGNYTGPFNLNADIQQFSLRFKALENVGGGLLYFIYGFDKSPTGASDNYANELNLYLEWGATENLFVSPVYSRYMPGKGFPGANTRDADYFQVIFIYKL